MSTYLDRYLAGEREAVWRELTALGPAIRDEPLFTDAYAVARETMLRARTNIELLVQRLTSLGYRFVSGALGKPPAPYAPPSAEWLTMLRDLETQFGTLPLSLEVWYEVVGAVDFMGTYPRLSVYEGISSYASGTLVEPLDVDADSSDPLVVWPPLEALVDLLEEPSDQARSEAEVTYSLGFAPDAIGKANASGGDGPYINFGDPSMDAPLHGDDWEGVHLVTYLRTTFAWGGFPGLREAIQPPREELAQLVAGLLPL